MVKKLKKIGNSKGFILSKDLLDLLDVKNDYIEIQINNKTLILKAFNKEGEKNV